MHIDKDLKDDAQFLKVSCEIPATPIEVRNTSKKNWKLLKVVNIYDLPLPVTLK
jgi:hypothetical protein